MRGIQGARVTERVSLQSLRSPCSNNTPPRTLPLLGRFLSPLLLPLPPAPARCRRLAICSGVHAPPRWRPWRTHLSRASVTQLTRMPSRTKTSKAPVWVTCSRRWRTTLLFGMHSRDRSQ